MKLALSILCENPLRRTGLTTLFHELVVHALGQEPDVRWVIFAGPAQPWDALDARVEVVRTFPSNERRRARLWADHLAVGPAARARGADALLTVGFLPLRAPLPVVMQVLALPPQAGGGRGVYRHWAVTRGLRHAALVIANSHWTAGQLGTCRAPLLVSHEGLQRERFHAQAEPGEAGKLRQAFPGLPTEYLLWSSNFYAYKRVELALAAYARLPVAVRTRFPLVLIGGDWEGGRARAQAEVVRLGIAAHTHFFGWVEDRWLPALYRGARAHVLPTEEETFGRSVLEAMACGCPCVVQDLAVLREVSAGAAEFVDFGERSAAATVLRRVCLDDVFAAELRAAGLRRAGDFGFEKLVSERLRAIRAVLGGRVA